MILHKDCLPTELTALTIGTDVTTGTLLLGNDAQFHALPAASLTVPGIVELATTAEAVTTDAVRAVTPVGLRTALFNETDFSATVAIAGITVAGVGTYTERFAFATRIGDRVWVNIGLATSAHTGTGGMRITGLPYTSKAVGGRTVFHIASSSTTFTAGSVLIGNLDNNASVINIQRQTNNTVLTAVAMDTTSTLYLSFSYRAA
jgi:hypothetical protein